jgi:hypothetical protein
LTLANEQIPGDNMALQCNSDVITKIANSSDGGDDKGRKGHRRKGKNERMKERNRTRSKHLIVRATGCG